MICDCFHKLRILVLSVCVWFSLVVFGLCCWLVGWLVVPPFSAATRREWWFCLHGFLGEGTNAQICVRTNVLAQIAMVGDPIYMSQTRILLEVDTHICVST